MGIEHKQDLLYRITICFNTDPSWGELGALRTYMVETGQCVIDTDTGALIGDYKPNPAVDLDKARAIALLDERFAGFADQIASERAATKALAAELGASQGRIADISRSLDEANANIAKLSEAAAESPTVAQRAAP